MNNAKCRLHYIEGFLSHVVSCWPSCAPFCLGCVSVTLLILLNYAQILKQPHGGGDTHTHMFGG